MVTVDGRRRRANNPWMYPALVLGVVCAALVVGALDTSTPWYTVPEDIFSVLNASQSDATTELTMNVLGPDQETFAVSLGTASSLFDQDQWLGVGAVRAASLGEPLFVIGLPLWKLQYVVVDVQDAGVVHFSRLN